MGHRLFAVVGMHRSGTSLLTRLINIAGVDLGPDEALLDAQPDNPRGFWENSDVRELHDALLVRLGGRWWNPPVLADGWELAPELDEYRMRAAAFAAGMRAASEVAAWKDPRGSLLLPLWQAATDVDATLIAIRHPAAVASSLQERQGFAPELAADLWLRYTVAARRASPDGLLVGYDELVDNVEDTLQRIVTHLELKLPDGRVVEAAHREVDASLRHHADIAVPDGPVMAEAVSLFELLTSGVEPGRILDGLHQRWLLGSERDALIAERDRLADSRDRLSSERAALLQRLRDQQRETDRLWSEIERRNETVGSLRDRLADLDSSVARLEDELTELRRESEAMRSSTSWRVTAPLRAVGDRFSALRPLRSGERR
jgi:hypothetical protein